jgi:hypothetical protein
MERRQVNGDKRKRMRRVDGGFAPESTPSASGGQSGFSTSKTA